jgi:serine protease Do
MLEREGWRLYRLLITFTILLLLIGCSAEVESPLVTSNETSSLSSKPQASREAFFPSFASIVARAKPAVVNIATTQTIKTPEGHPFFGPGPFGENNPLEEFFRRFFPDMPKTLKRQSLGSGFVIDPQGIIVTNHHVVNRAEKIVVRLEKKEFEAQLLGSDPATDLAILKIRSSEELPILNFADSSQMQVGDWVIAIGNPFGLSQTVTAGIVSATGRVIGQGPYDDFIQTDASINPGNSGGPLLNLKGEVIGINTAIFSQTGGNIGIGFAIPSNIAHGITKELRTHGKVVRGWLGVAIQDLDEDLAKAFGLSEIQGALVAGVGAKTPADTAGLKRGDVIVSFREKSVKSAHDLSRKVAATEPGTKAAIEVIRKGKKQTLTAKIGEQPSKSDAQ